MDKNAEQFVKGALAALSQNKVFDADIELAKSFLNAALHGGYGPLVVEECDAPAHEGPDTHFLFR